MTDPRPSPRPITMDDLQPALCVAMCRTRYGREIEVPFYPLSWQEWDDLGRRVKDPDVPKTRLAEDGNTLLPNPEDAKYLRDLERKQEERVANRLMTMLSRGGNVFPGETLLTQFDALKQGDRALVESMIRRIYGAGVEGISEVQALADSFQAQSSPASDTPDTETSELERVEQPA